ncbi:hypothetical protein BD410DRAFT_789098 [Rickenella mellea]|uniref:G-protein coupled receptors family 1 profile domain-containing protein n=1 Tax=Rickenella mellea TaxID=50990 RepID=A0A4Y7Q5B9_9AGAM|nr:hypothetical protein BD410DRAFT_789098 [Rickenella mellea]
MSSPTTPPTVFPILNPATALAFLPPDVADQLEISRYVYVATLGAYLWDTLTNLNNDRKLLFNLKCPIRLPTIAYFLSRVATLAFLSSATVFPISAVKSCQTLLVAVGACSAVAIPATSFLFFLRVRAIFNASPWVVRFFAVIWIATLGGSVTVPFAIQGGHIGPTQHCIDTAVKSFSSAGIIILTCNDTMVFLAISWRMLTTARDDSLNGKMKSFFSGEGLPHISRILMQGGQLYYMITVGVNIVTMTLILTPSIPPVLHPIVTVPNLAIENMMACRVFRAVKFGLTTLPQATFQKNMQMQQPGHILSSLMYASPPPGPPTGRQLRPEQHADSRHFNSVPSETSTARGFAMDSREAGWG